MKEEIEHLVTAGMVDGNRSDRKDDGSNGAMVSYLTCCRKAEKPNRKRKCGRTRL